MTVQLGESDLGPDKVIEDAWLTATVSESGSALCRVLVALRNTQRQFLRIFLPERGSDRKKADIWSAMVNGVPVKPAIDSENTVLIPLLKATSGSSTSSAVLYVELVFLESLPVMDKRGKLSLTFSRFDLPVQRMFLTTNLPVNYVYGQFEGDLKEVARHRKGPPNVSRERGLPHPPVQRTRARMERCASFGSEESGRASLQSLLIPAQAQGMENCLVDLEEAPEEACDALDRGVVPVAIGAMEEGTAFRFESLLVLNEAYTVSVPYKRQHVSVRKSSHCCALL